MMIGMLLKLWMKSFQICMIIQIPMMKLIHAVELRYQVGFYGPNSKKKTVRRIGMRAILKVNYAVVYRNPNHEK